MKKSKRRLAGPSISVPAAAANRPIPPMTMNLDFLVEAAIAGRNWAKFTDALL